jgi:AP-1 complex subunit gamma-1
VLRARELTLRLQAGNYVREEVLSAFIRLTCHTPELQAYTAQKLFSALHADFSQESLTLAAVWVIGEFGETLLQGGSYDEEEAAREVQAKDMVDLLASVLDSPYANSHIRQWVLTALAKMTTRISDSAQQARIERLLHGYDASVEVEIQQRAVEFGALLARKDIRAGVLEPMPPPEIRQTVVGTVSEKRAVGSTRTDKDALLDLMGDEMPSGGAQAAAGGAAPAASAQSTQDLLADIFGGMGNDAPASAAISPSSAQPKSSMSDIMGLFGNDAPAASAPAPSSSSSGLDGLMVMSSAPSASAGLGGLDIFGGAGPSSQATSPPPAAASPPPAAAPAAAAAPRQYTAYDQKGLRVTLAPSISAARPDVVNLTARFTSTAGEVSGVNFQAAVPKVRDLRGMREPVCLPLLTPPCAISQSQKLQMLAISNPTVSPGKTETQQLRVMIPAGVSCGARGAAWRAWR